MIDYAVQPRIVPAKKLPAASTDPSNDHNIREIPFNVSLHKTPVDFGGTSSKLTPDIMQRIPSLYHPSVMISCTTVS
jgi:hypothetical protein